MIKKLFLWLHRWLGLASGIIVCIVSLTGCIYVFSDELKELVYKDRLFVETSGNQVLPLSVLRERAQEALGSAFKITRCDIYPHHGRSWIFRASETDKKAIGHWNYYKYYYRVYVNPYNGKILHIEDSRNEFFQLILSLHMNLLLGKRIGSPLVGYAVLAFIGILLTGVVLWWPKQWRKKKLKKNFLVKWDASKKRLNHDFHNVLGFYIILPIFIIALTGLVFSFKWIDHSLQYFFNGGKASIKRVIPQPATAVGNKDNALNHALYTVLRLHPNADLLSIRFRAEEAPIDVQTRLLKSQTHVFVWYYFDRQNGQLLTYYSNEDIHGGEKLRSMNYDLHVGSIGGIGTKLLAFAASLICASLPITGFLIWYYKKQKKTKKYSDSYLNS